MFKLFVTCSYVVELRYPIERCDSISVYSSSKHFMLNICTLSPRCGDEVVGDVQLELYMRGLYFDFSCT